MKNLGHYFLLFIFNSCFLWWRRRWSSSSSSVGSSGSFKLNAGSGSGSGSGSIQAQDWKWINWKFQVQILIHLNYILPNKVEAIKVEYSKFKAKERNYEKIFTIFTINITFTNIFLKLIMKIRQKFILQIMKLRNS